MSSRDEILNRLRRQARPETLPPVWRSQREFADLAARFTESLTAAKGEVRRAESLERAWAEVDAILREVGAQAVVANNEPPLNAIALAARWPDCEWHVVDQTPGDLRQFCARADIGLSGVEAALAETGSLVVHSGPGKSRMVTLLPPVHIALVPVSGLMPDIFIWTAARAGKMPANVILISGPSKSADIEMTLVLGVHGPRRLIAVLYDTGEMRDSRVAELRTTD
ncbi:MAG: lactate utilization protein [Candidatus Poribacteria bacterium]|nr:lactate utilization protein [Candidatus Poribacteria bacterium]